ncbi:hypothetical protein FB446DRAFT_632631, partial [Lentinula raphanica]
MHTASQIHLGQARDTSANLELPTTAELETLLMASLLDENGQKIAFGDILSAAATTSEKTVIVLFLRHFWCPLDQDYVQELVDILRRLKAIPQVILVSNGSPALITKYKEIFDIAGKNGPRLKISMFTDPSCRTYRMLGMENSGSPSRSYIKHASAVGGIATVVMRAIKVGMPVWEKGGVIKQLGGELVNSNVNVACMYAHRMSHSQDHTPFEDVLKMA